MKKPIAITTSPNMAAGLPNVAPSEFLSLGLKILLLRRCRIRTYERWDTSELIQIARGQATEGFSDVDW